MTEETFEQLETLKETQGPDAAIDKLIETLRAEQNYHKLFDALLLKKRFQMGLPLARPTSFDDVPEEQRREFEESYIAAAREVGELLLADNLIPQAWVYLRTIREPEKVAQAIEALEPPDELDEQSEQIINIALFEGANPVKGLEMMLHTHGTCNTITALDQAMHQLQPEDRARAAALLVDDVYRDLCYTLRQEVERKLAGIPPGETLRELIAGRDWLFEGDNYHIDVSHLHSVVRFARFLDRSSPQLQKAIHLAEYGCRLSPQFQYPGDSPFDEFYPAHLQYFKVLADEDREEGLDYFRHKLESEPDADDKPILAFALVDLLVRIDRLDEAVQVAQTYLKDLDESSGFSFAELCQQAGRMDTLRQAAREKGDLVSYTAALIQDGTDAASTQ